MMLHYRTTVKKSYKILAKERRKGRVALFVIKRVTKNAKAIFANQESRMRKLSQIIVSDGRQLI